MSSFWGVEVKPGKPYTLTHGDFVGRLRLTQATLGVEGEKAADRKKCVVQCSVQNKDPVFLCVLVPEQSETCHLELEFEEEVTFSVLGSRSVHLAGYYMTDAYGEDMSGSDSGSDSLQGSDEDGSLEEDDDNNLVMGYSDSEDDSEFDSESDDEDMAYNQRRGKSSVVIEEIQEDDKAAASEVQKGSNKKQCSENGNKSQLQLAVRNPPTESVESEDEDGFPVKLSESKESSEGVSTKKGGTDKENSNEERKRKIGAISNRCDSSGEVKAEIEGASKKKKKSRDKSTAMDTGKINTEEKDTKQQDSPADPVSAKQKKKKNKNKSTSEGDASEQSSKNINIHKDDDEAAQEASKKNKKKAQDINRSENQAATGPGESNSEKQPLQTRTFANGMIIEDVAMGKPDGKKATRGKKVSVRYIGKLKNGTIFDSNVSGRPFEFRLGVGQVISGWDVGVNGMRIGDKRRLTIPPSMGYGSKRVGKIPQNSTLIFDVELVNVK